MNTSALAPLQPLGPSRGPAITVSGSGVQHDAPLLWATWTGTPTIIQPNPGINRPVSKPERTVEVTLPEQDNLLRHLTAMSTLAHSLQQTSETVTKAHAQFLENQENALNQIQQINALFEAIRQQH